MCGAMGIAFGDDELGYIEWEDDFLITPNGCQLLTPLDKHIRMI